MTISSMPRGSESPIQGSRRISTADRISRLREAGSSHVMADDARNARDAYSCGFTFQKLNFLFDPCSPAARLQIGPCVQALNDYLNALAFTAHGAPVGCGMS